MPDAVVLATYTDKITSDSNQPSTLVVGTTASGVVPYNAVFTSDASNPSTIVVGTTASLTATYTTTFSTDTGNTLVVGTVATWSSTVSSMPTMKPEAMTLGTQATASATVTSMPTGVPGTAIMGTLATMSAIVSTMPTGVQPSVFSRLHLNDGSATYTPLDATLFMTKGTAGGANSKARIVLDLGSLKKIKSIAVTSGVSDSLGDQKIKKIVVYSSTTNFTKSDANFISAGYTFGGNQVGTLVWSTSSSASQQQTDLAKKL